MIKSKKLKNVDMLLLLLYADNGRSIYGRTRLQKMVFVFENEIMRQFGFDKVLKESGPKAGFSFLAHNYGPFSKEIFDHMDFLINVGMVNAKFSENQSEEVLEDLDDEDILLDDMSNDPEFSPEEEDIARGYPEYILTDSGKTYVKEKILPVVNREQLAALEELKRRFNSYDLATILKYVYKKYPSMASESRIRDRILRQ